MAQVWLELGWNTECNISDKMKFFEQPSKTLFEIAAYIYSQLQAHLILVTNYTNNDNVSVFLVSISCRNCCSSENFRLLFLLYRADIWLPDKKDAHNLYWADFFRRGMCLFFYQAIKYLKLKKKSSISEIKGKPPKQITKKQINK